MCDIVPENFLKEQQQRNEDRKKSGSIERVHKNFREIQLTKLWGYNRGNSPDIISHPQREKIPSHTI